MSIYGNITHPNDAIAKDKENLLGCRERMEMTRAQLETTNQGGEKIFPKKEEPKKKIICLSKFNVCLQEKLCIIGRRARREHKRERKEQSSAEVVSINVLGNQCIYI